MTSSKKKVSKLLLGIFYLILGLVVSIIFGLGALILPFALEQNLFFKVLGVIGGITFFLLGLWIILTKAPQALEQAGFSYQDQTRDRLCVHLQSIGVNAQLEPRGRNEEECRDKITEHSRGYSADSLGLIKIEKSPIQWVNVIRWSEPAGDNTNKGYLLNCCIHDPRPLNELGMMQIRAIRKKDYPVFGHVVGVSLQVTPGGGRFEKIAHEFEADEQLKASIIHSHRLGSADLQIKVCSIYSSWLIEVPKSAYFQPPTLGEWKCYETIANRLLSITLQR
jgi:hypothetical protein